MGIKFQVSNFKYQIQRGRNIFLFYFLLLEFWTWNFGLGISSFAQSGINWITPVNIAVNSYGNLHPRVVIDAGGNPLVIWGNSSSKKVFFSRWNGSGFTTPVALNNTSEPVFVYSWAGATIASLGDTVYVAYKRIPEDTNHIFVVHSYDGGVNFSSPVRVDNIADSNSRFSTVTTDENGNPLIGFMKFDPGFMKPRYVVCKSNDFGNSFSTDVLASGFSGGYVCDCCPGSLVSSGSNVWMLYRDNLNDLRNIWGGISKDTGNSFMSGIQADNTNWIINTCPSSGPDGVIIGDTMYSVFMSGASGKNLCYLNKTSITNPEVGATNPLTDVFTGLIYQNYPRIANSGKQVAIVWKQRISSADQIGLFFTNNIENGFPQDYEVIATNYITNTDVFLDNGTIYVVWEDDNAGTVRYRKGTYSITAISEIKKDINFAYIYPNPISNNELFIRVDNNLELSVEYTVLNLLGQEMINHVSKNENRLIRVDVSSIKKGIYFIRIISGDYSTIQKMIKY